MCFQYTHTVGVPERLGSYGNGETDVDAQEGETQLAVCETMMFDEDDGEGLECEVDYTKDDCTPEIQQENHLIEQDEFYLRRIT